MEGSPLLRWLLQFRGFRESLLADDLFLAKLSMECSVIAKTATDYEKRIEDFVKEIDIVISDVNVIGGTTFHLPPEQFTIKGFHRRRLLQGGACSDCYTTMSLFN